MLGYSQIWHPSLFSSRWTAPRSGWVAVSCVWTTVIFFVITQVHVIYRELSVLVSYIGHAIKESLYCECWYHKCTRQY